jgi:hypothetical protein
MLTRASKRGRALSGKPFVSHRADRDYGTTVLSVLAGAHSVGEGVLGFFDTREARALRLVCSEFREAVAVVPWADMGTRIRGNVRGWRASFPRATKANISVDFSYPQRHNAIIDADFVHFEGIYTLNMSWCNQAGITDSAFVHLKGIHTLNMVGCSQAGITDAAFFHLKGIHTLDMSGCHQAGITDAAFVHLKGIHTLNMRVCNQAGITDAAFVHLKGIHSLDIRYCTQGGITFALTNRLRATVPNLSM